MAISVGDIQAVYSGGAANTSQAASLGGAISTAGANKITSQTATAPVNVTGVTILDAMGNPTGAGVLKWDFALQQLTWKPFGGLSFDGLTITTNGNYTLGTAGGYLYVSVVFASLPGSTLQDTITIAGAVNKAFDNISAYESLNGDDEYRCFYIKNTHATDTAFDIRIWIKSQPAGADTLSIALDPNGKNASARGPLNDEQDSTTVLTGITFSAPSTYAAALSGIATLAPGEYFAFWVKRHVPVGTTTQIVDDISSLSISALI